MLANFTPIPELYVSYDSAQKLKSDAAHLISWDLTPRQICDLELLMNGMVIRLGKHDHYWEESDSVIKLKG